MYVNQNYLLLSKHRIQYILKHSLFEAKYDAICNISDLILECKILSKKGIVE